MAKRAPVDQKPFNALDKGLAASVMGAQSSAPTMTAEAPATDEASSLIETEVETNDPAAEVVQPSERLPTPARANPTPVPRKPVAAAKPVVATKPAAVDHSPKEKLSREKRVLLTPSEEREIERCVDRIAEGFGGTPVKLSHLVRACLTVLRHSEAEVIRRAQDVGELTRPPNGDVMALAEFEHELAKVLSHAFRDAPALR